MARQGVALWVVPALCHQQKCRGVHRAVLVESSWSAPLIEISSSIGGLDGGRRQSLRLSDVDCRG